MRNHINDMILRQGSTVQPKLFLLKISLQCYKIEVGTVSNEADKVGKEHEHGSHSFA